MPTPTKGPRLGGSPAHERLMLANLATSLFRAAMTGLHDAAREVKEKGTFTYLDRLIDVNKFMRR